MYDSGLSNVKLQDSLTCESKVVKVKEIIKKKDENTQVKIQHQCSVFVLGCSLTPLCSVFIYLFLHWVLYFTVQITYWHHYRSWCYGRERNLLFDFLKLN